MIDKLESFALLTIAQNLYTEFHGDIGHINGHLETLNIPENLIRDIKKVIQFLNTGNQTTPFHVYDLLLQLGLFRRMFNTLTPNTILLRSAFYGHRALVMEAISRGANDLNSALTLAAEYGHREIVADLARDNTSLYFINEAMITAAEHGHREIVADLIVRGVGLGLNRAMAMASKNGHIDIVNDLIERGASDFKWAIIMAAMNGHAAVVDILISRAISAGAPIDYNEAMIRASEGGHFDIVANITDRATAAGISLDYNAALMKAARRGHRDLVVDIIDRATAAGRRDTLNLDDALLSADSNHYSFIVDDLKARGAKDRREVSGYYYVAPPWRDGARRRF